MTPPHSLALRAAHWISAALVLGMLATGMMYFWEINAKQAITAHQYMGQILILVLIWRLAVKLGAAKRDHKSHAAWERALAGGVQIALYGVLIAFVITGYVSASALRESALLLPVDFAFARSAAGEQFLQTHYALKWALLGLLALHIAGALKHHFIDRDSTLTDIWFTTKRGD